VASSDSRPTPNGIDARKKRFSLWTQHFKRKSIFLESIKAVVVGSLLLSTFTLYVFVENIPDKHDFPLRNIDVPLPVRKEEPALKLSDALLPGPLEIGSDDDGFDGADYGELDFDFLSKHDSIRNIKYTGGEKFFRQFAPEDDPMKGKAYYHAYDDDVKRNPYHAFRNGEVLAKENHCRQVAWHRDFFPNCNDFHSLDTPARALRNQAKYLGGGSYRQVFLVNQDLGNTPIVLKTVPLDDYRMKDYEYYRVDAAVTAAVSPHPLIVDMYGHCALSMFSEAMSRGDLSTVALPVYERGHSSKVYLETEELTPLNNLDGTTKLEWALQIAESVAVLHNHEKGVIVHDDIRIYQWLITEDNNLKLNDFNRAEIMLYDEEHGRYCKYRNGPCNGSNRSPEEYMNAPLNEKIDVYSIANVFYSLLTGVLAIYKEPRTSKVGKHVLAGEKSFIHPTWRNHSYAEGELVKLIEECWERHPDRRLGSGEVVRKLRAAVEKNRNLAKG